MRFWTSTLYCMLVQSDPSSSSWITLDLVIPGGDHLRVHWAAHSPDLNPIEHAWDMLQFLYTMSNQQLSATGKCITEEWNNLEMAAIQRLTGSTRRHCQAVIASRGSHTKY